MTLSADKNDDSILCSLYNLEMHVSYKQNRVHCSFISKLVTQVDERRHVGNSRVHIFSIIGSLGTANLKFVNDWRNVFDSTT